MLKLEHISKIFGQRTVLKDVSATINTGDFIIIVGANGSGKSTLFNIIAGTLQADSGNILLTAQGQAQDITNSNDIARTNYIAQLFQNPKVNTVDSMTVAQNLALALMKGKTVGLDSGKKVITHEMVTYIHQEYGVDVAPFLNKNMRELSGGQRQLIAFIMATLHRPALLLLDEPTAALDPQAATTLLKCAYRFIKDHNMTALLVTHDPQLALTLGNKLWLIGDGKLQEFTAEQKASLSPQDLVGHIDYEQIISH
jgi:putative ABC transport system ATP-binding protein